MVRKALRLFARFEGIRLSDGAKDVPLAGGVHGRSGRECDDSAQGEGHVGKRERQIIHIFSTLDPTLSFLL